jgi:hypothetical protein
MRFLSTNRNTGQDHLCRLLRAGETSIRKVISLADPIANDKQIPHTGDRWPRPAARAAVPCLDHITGYLDMRQKLLRHHHIPPSRL